MQQMAIRLLWQFRKPVAKIIAAVFAVLMLPVIFVLMLPSLLFGGLSDESVNPGIPILNDENAIVENVNKISFAINSVMSDGIDDVTARIEADFASSGGDKLEIINPYADDPAYNGNIFISQYCAAKAQDIDSISLTDMEAVLRDGKSHLYSYIRSTENRDRTVVETKTQEETVVTEQWMIYTITFNGESHFADNVFHLTEEQKELADNYAYNMSLFLGDGMYQGLLPEEFNIEFFSSNLSFTDGQTPVVYFNQLDERYKSKPYGTDKIGSHGCGPTSMAIVVSSLTEQTVDPVQMAKWSYENGGWCKNSGSYHALIPKAAKAWGLTVEGCKASEPQRIIDALSSGKLVVAIMKKGHFTKGGHFIVLRGIKDGKILVADPASYKRSEQLWDLSIILNEASKYAAAGGPFWLIGVGE